jgi:lipooligosaccharide transport system permease protein
MTATLSRSRPTAYWLRALYGFLLQFRRTWKSSVAMNFVYPVLYLTAMGVGLGALVNRHLAATHSDAIGGVPYVAFIAPGILASSAMQIAVSECTWPILGRIKWEKTYLAMLQSPLRVVDVLIGQLGFVLLRLATTSTVFVVIMWAYGTIHSLEALFALPIGALVGMAFATPCVAFSSTQQSDNGFSTINRLVVVPLFLFSGSFFPITQLPGYLQVLAVATPLYHGVALARAATLGHLATWSTCGHLAYLVALAGIGLALSKQNFERRLAQ